jgi:hypothetical protein
LHRGAVWTFAEHDAETGGHSKLESELLYVPARSASSGGSRRILHGRDFTPGLDDNPDHPMRKPQSMRIDQYREDTLTDVTRAFNGIFYLDRMIPDSRYAHPRAK